MSNSIANIEAIRIITHTAPIKKDEDSRITTERLSVSEKGGLDLVSRRIGQRLGAKSHSIEMMLTYSSAFSFIKALLGTNTEFIKASKDLTTHLINCQTAGSIQSGTAVYTSGSCFFEERICPFVAIVKADKAEAIRLHYETDSKSVLEYLSDVIFSEGSRLLKIGFLVLTEDVDPKGATPDNFRVFIFDQMLSENGANDAAQYFYSAFLGCSPLKEAPKKVQKIFSLCKSTINKSEKLTDLEKAEHNNLLKFAFKDKSRVSISAYSVAQTVFGTDLPDEFDAFIGACEKADCNGTYENDTTLIKHDLKVHKIRIRSAASDVTISGSPESIKDHLIIDEQKDARGWTLIHVEGKVVPV